MTLDNQHWERISAYLSGDLSQDERSAFESWLQASDSNRILFHEARLVWESSRLKLQIKNPATEEELLRLLARIKSEQQPGGRVISLFRNSALLKIAASITLVTIAAYFYWTVRDSETVIASGDEVLTLYLPDSSRVWLNTNSSLSYTEDFTKENRTVNLKGEAYFQVKRDTAHTFEVITPTTTAAVLGTSFNVKDADSTTTVTVAEGKVRFAERDVTKKEEDIVLTSREQATFHHRKKTIDRSRSRDMKFAAWRKYKNAQYEKEMQNSALYLATRYKWRKNQINQSVIEGTIHNSASLAVYKDIVLYVTYSQPGGPQKTSRLVIGEVVRPGQTIDYRRRLLDIFTETSVLHVKVESAEVETGDQY
jgi:ferric-dicitrate binding protein FerR (iron transport regulator)